MIISVNDDPLLCHIALYIRDVCDLVVPKDERNVPRLIGEVNDLHDELSHFDRETAGRQWLEWWKHVLILQSQLLFGQSDHLAGKRDQSNKLTKAYNSVFDWPRFDSLRSKPELMRAAQIAFPSARNWTSTSSLRRVAQTEHPSIGGELLREVNRLYTAQISDVFQRRFIGVLVLAVDGLWTAIVEPGVICCSQSILTDKPRILSTIERALLWPDSHNDVLDAHQPDASTISVPPSVIQPMVLWRGQDFILSCERILPYPDGFEIEVRLTPEPTFVTNDEVQAPTSPRNVGPRGEVDQFVGLALELDYADGRSGVMSESLKAANSKGTILLSRFWRDTGDPNTLWIWVSPLPPSGDVTLRLRWENRGVDQIQRRIDGSLLATRST